MDDLRTESDVEQKLLYPLLSQPLPRGLGYAGAEIQTKRSLKRLTIGKGASARLYYPDYAVVVEGVPLLVVEAKTRGEDIVGAAAEGRMYAAKINELFPSGVNPCRWVLSANGDELLVTAWDSASATFSLAFDDIAVSGLKYADLVEQLGRETTSVVVKEFRKGAVSRPFKRAVSLMGGKSVRNEQIGHNTFGSALALDFQGIFTPVSPEERAFVVTNAYVGSKRRDRYVEPIEKLVRRATLPFLRDVQQLDDSESPVEVVGALRKGASLEHQIMLLVGSVGSGKSTFVDYLVNVALPKDVLKNTLWLRVNLNIAPKEGVQKWLLDQVCAEFGAVEPDVDLDDVSFLQTLFKPELANFRRGPISLLPEESMEYRTRLVDEMLRLKTDNTRVVNALSRRFCGERGKLMVLALDNCDKRTRDEQLEMFELAQWVQAELHCLTILPLRDVTYDTYQNRPPLDAAQKSLVFRIEPPQFTRVLSARVALTLQRLAPLGDSQLEYTLSNGIRVSYPASDQGMYLASILRSLYEHDRFLRRLLTGLAGRNIRKALEIFLEFCQSGYISEGEILKIRQFKGNYALPLPIVASVLLRGSRRFYDGDVSHIKNVFQAVPDDTRPTQFSRLAILNCLSAMSTRQGPSGAKGYHPVSTVLASLARLGHAVEVIRREVRYLLEAGCVVAEHLSDEVEDEDLVALTPAGSVHLEMLDSVHYLAACAEDTWFSDGAAVDRIAGRIGRTRLAHMADTTVMQNAKELVEQLAAEESAWPTETTEILSEELAAHAHDWTAARETVEGATREQRRLARQGRFFLGNLPFDATHDEVASAIADAGLTVVDIYLPLEDGGNGKNKGYAFISTGTSDHTDQNLETLGKIRIRGRNVRADIAAQKKGSR